MVAGGEGLSNAAKLQAIKASSGASWSTIAQALGTDAVEFVRKVGSGAKPGANLTGAIDELYRTGTVRRATVSRRRSRSGRLAATRRKRDAVEHRTPSVTALMGDGGWRALVDVELPPLGVSDPDEWDRRIRQREEDRQRLFATIKRAAASRRKGSPRVAFQVGMGTERGAPSQWLDLGGHGGYYAPDVVKAIGAAGDDPLEWLGAIPDPDSVGEGGVDLDEIEGEIQASIEAASRQGMYVAPNWTELGDEVWDVCAVEVISFAGKKNRGRKK